MDDRLARAIAELRDAEHAWEVGDFYALTAGEVAAVAERRESARQELVAAVLASPVDPKADEK